MSNQQGWTRRSAIHALGIGTGSAVLLPWLSDQGLAAFAVLQQSPTTTKPTVLSNGQFATLGALVDAIIPTDDRSPGAKEARVAGYIDLLLSEVDDHVALQWMGGLAALDEASVARFKKPFVQLDAAASDAMMSAISAHENEPDRQTPLEAFFVMTKRATIQGYYTSEIGIHRDLRYKGNQIIKEFVGCKTEDGKDCPDCGQKARR